MPPAPPSFDRSSPRAHTDFDVDIDIDDVKVSGKQAKRLRQIARGVSEVNERAGATIEEKSEELRQLIASNRKGADIDQQIGDLVDEISRAEAEIRKARLRALVQTRGLLDDEQRAPFEPGTR